MKLKYLLCTVFILIAAVPLFAGLQYLNQHTSDHYREQFEDHLSSLSLIAKERVLTSIERIKDNTALISSRTQLRISLDQFNDSQDSDQKAKILQIINDAKHGLSHLKDISIFDRKGGLVASTSYDPPSGAIDLKNVAKPTIRLEQEDRQIIARSTSPLILHHQTVGFIQISFYSHFITDLVRERAGLGETGEWLIAVRHESGDALFAVPLKYDHKAAFSRRVSKDRHDVPITQALLGNERIMRDAPDYLEQPVLASTRYISELDWGLVAKVNEEEVNRLLAQNNRVIYAAELVIILLSVAVGIALSIYISGPIEKLKQHTEKVTRGNLEEPPTTPAGWYEVKELTTHFAYMIKNLKEFNHDLQTRIDERTKDLQDANRTLERLTILDPLTGLYNRRYLDDALAQEVSRSQRYGHPLTVVMMDIDHFKKVNDTHGHAMGDEVLIKISEYINTALRESDIAARMGGEEFCIVLIECPVEASLAFLERIRAHLEHIKFSDGDIEFNITCSFGVATLDQNTNDERSLLEQADKALYEAKNSGRNCIVEFTLPDHAAPIKESEKSQGIDTY